MFQLSSASSGVLEETYIFFFPFHSVSYDIEPADKLSLREIDMFSTYLPKLREHLLLFWVRRRVTKEEQLH